jgi:hypothetical protein
MQARACRRPGMEVITRPVTFEALAAKIEEIL